MAAKPLTDKIREKKEAMAALKRQIAELEEKEALRLGKIAVAAGLADVEIDEDALRTAFADVAARFHPGEKTASAAPAPSSGSADQGNEPRNA